MSLISRLVAPAPGEDKLAVHQFSAALGEWNRGAPGVTQKSISDAFDLNPKEAATMVTIKKSIDSGAYTREMMEDVLMLGEGSAFDGNKHYSIPQIKIRLNI